MKLRDLTMDGDGNRPRIAANRGLSAWKLGIFGQIT